MLKHPPLTRVGILLLALLAFGQPSADAWSPGDETSVEIPEALSDIVSDLFPEKSNAGAAFISDTYSPNLVITDDCNVYVIFVWEGAGYRNSLGWFTYTEADNGDVTVEDANLIWADASFPSAGKMAEGDLVALLDANGDEKEFKEGEKVGFFLVANGYSSSDEIDDWDASSPTLPKVTPAGNEAIDKGCYTTIDRINPEYDSATPEKARHVAMVKVAGISGFLDGEEFFLTGFEDLDRTGNSDDDFNDLMFVVTANPITGIDETSALAYEADDVDKDGLSGSADQYPDDGGRATITRTPNLGFNVVALEDNYPGIGDADYNDAVVAYAFEVVADSDGKVKDIQGTFHLLARGAEYDHRFGVHISGIPSTAKGTVRVERFLSDADKTTTVEPSATVASLIDSRSRRIDNLFPSTADALPKPEGDWFTNTRTSEPDVVAASARFNIEFTTSVSASALGSVPYDLYFTIKHDAGESDVHLPGFSGFSDRPHWLPTESGSTSFMDDTDYPWMIEVPSSWQFPLERISIQDAYSEFSLWRTSKGSKNTSWYLNPTSTADRVASELTAYIPARTWAVNLPAQ